MNEERVKRMYEVLQRRSRGESLRGISRATGLNRRTVRSLLQEARKRREEGDSALQRVLPPSRTPRGSKLDVHEPKIRAWLEQYPDLTAQRVLEKLREDGYAGGYSIVRQYVKALRPEPEEKRAFSVVETAPGAQCQFDWSPYKLADDTPVQAWSCILSWSRGRYMEGTDNTKQTTILRMLDRSFRAFGGVPAQAVTDSMPGVVDRWECDRPILNIRFVDFAAYYDFSVDIAPRRDPRYKGKVERSFWSTELSFLNGRTFHSMEQFRQALAYWLENTVHQWKHPVTRRPLAEMMAEERSYLKPLPARPYDMRDVCIRIVDTQGFVLHETNRYRIPDKAIGERVYLCVGEDRIEVFDDRVHRLADHERLPDGSGAVTGLPGCKARRRYDLDLLTERLAPWGQPVIDFISALRSRQHYPGVHLSRLLNLQLTWSTDDIVKAVEHALLYHAHDAAAVERILKARFRPRTLDEQIAQRTRDHVRQVMQHHPVLQRPLSAYTTLACGDKAATTTPQEEEDEEREE